jgi:hypothetical protein
MLTDVLPFRKADADNDDAAEAILQGLKDRHEKTENIPSLVHTVSNFTLSW